jgi:hypothetical protein
MSRTTVDIDDPILEEVKRVRDQEGKSLGRVISDLLAWAIADRNKPKGHDSKLEWTARPMGARFELKDKDVLYRVLDGEYQK